MTGIKSNSKGAATKPKKEKKNKNRSSGDRKSRDREAATPKGDSNDPLGSSEKSNTSGSSRHRSDRDGKDKARGRRGRGALSPGAIAEKVRSDNNNSDDHQPGAFEALPSAAPSRGETKKSSGNSTSRKKSSGKSNQSSKHKDRDAKYKERAARRKGKGNKATVPGAVAETNDDSPREGSKRRKQRTARVDMTGEIQDVDTRQRQRNRKLIKKPGMTAAVSPPASPNQRDSDQALPFAAEIDDTEEGVSHNQGSDEYQVEGSLAAVPATQSQVATLGTEDESPTAIGNNNSNEKKEEPFWCKGWFWVVVLLILVGGGVGAMFALRIENKATTGAAVGPNDDASDPTPLDVTSSPYPSVAPSLRPSSNLNTTQAPASPPPTTKLPTAAPNLTPSTNAPAGSSDPTLQPTIVPDVGSDPVLQPTIAQSMNPTVTASQIPTGIPTDTPSFNPTLAPIAGPSPPPSEQPSKIPTTSPSANPTFAPFPGPSPPPSSRPSRAPSFIPSTNPSMGPSGIPTRSPSSTPTVQPSGSPSSQQTPAPSSRPTPMPSSRPTIAPSSNPSPSPTNVPTERPTFAFDGHGVRVYADWDNLVNAGVDDGMYFLFIPSDWEAVFGSIPAVGSSMTVNIEQRRNDQVIWRGVVRIWNDSSTSAAGIPDGFEHGRREPLSSRANGQWETGDIIVPRYVPLNIDWRSGWTASNLATVGRYFKFYAEDWEAAFGFDPMPQTADTPAITCRNGQQVYEGSIRTFTTENGRRTSGSASGNFESDDYLLPVGMACPTALPRPPITPVSTTPSLGWLGGVYFFFDNNDWEQAFGFLTWGICPDTTCVSHLSSSSERDDNDRNLMYWWVRQCRAGSEVWSGVVATSVGIYFYPTETDGVGRRDPATDFTTGQFQSGDTIVPYSRTCDGA